MIHLDFFRITCKMYGRMDKRLGFVDKLRWVGWLGWVSRVRGAGKVHCKVGFDWCTYMYVYIGCMMEWLLLCECMYM